MKIILSMRNGHTVELPDCSQKDFEKLSGVMSSIKSYFVWNDRTWVRKKDVLAFALVPVAAPAVGNVHVQEKQHAA